MTEVRKFKSFTTKEAALKAVNDKYGMRNATKGIGLKVLRGRGEG